MYWMWMDVIFLVIFLLSGLIYAIQNFAPYFSPTIERTPRTHHHEKTNRKFRGGGSNRTERSAVFSTFDRNGDGFITKQELAELLRGSGMDMSDKDISDEFEKVDSNGDGLIDFEEFCGIYESKETRGEEEELREAFDAFDGNGDGLITAEELGLMLSSLGMKETGNSLIKCREMIKSVDRDGDGMVNYEEFKRMMMIAKSGPGIVLPPT